MSSFTFQWPELLALLLLLIPMGWLLLRARIQRAAVLQSMGASKPTNRRTRDSLRLVAWGLIALAVARPGYDPFYQSSSQAGRDVVFALDVSQSMLARDVSPNRLEIAKQGVRDALDSMTEERVGLIVYAGSASILCPLTYDYDFVRYMLDQANPRTVDFGGTTLQSAVEKSVDQVFSSDRMGFQDLIVLTDGGDHGSQMERVESLLSKTQTGLLIIGLGDPNTGSPIPLSDDNGEPTLLEIDGETILTKLEDAALRNFSNSYPNVRYIPAMTSPFNLGQLYADYAEGKLAVPTDSSSGRLVYKEAAIFFLIPALILLLFAERLGSSGFRLHLWTLGIIYFCIQPPELHAGNKTQDLRPEFETINEQISLNQFEDALIGLDQILEEQEATQGSRAQSAAIYFNRGLCLFKLSESQADQALNSALEFARSAQLSFLKAKAYSQELKRAEQWLELTHQMIVRLEERIEEEKSQEPDTSQQQASQESDSEAYEDQEYDYDDEYSDMGENRSDSTFSEGDLAAGAEMQGLPTPNYSIEDILLEEKGNLQFRQQKRANANASKVEKDY